MRVKDGGREGDVDGREEWKDRKGKGDEIDEGRRVEGEERGRIYKHGKEGKKRIGKSDLRLKEK